MPLAPFRALDPALLQLAITLGASDYMLPTAPRHKRATTSPETIYAADQNASHATTSRDSSNDSSSPDGNKRDGSSQDSSGQTSSRQDGSSNGSSQDSSGQSSSRQDGSSKGSSRHDGRGRAGWQLAAPYPLPNDVKRVVHVLTSLGHTVLAVKPHALNGCTVLGVRLAGPSVVPHPAAAHTDSAGVRVPTEGGAQPGLRSENSGSVATGLASAAVRGSVKSSNATGARASESEAAEGQRDGHAAWATARSKVNEAHGSVHAAAAHDTDTDTDNAHHTLSSASVARATAATTGASGAAGNAVATPGKRQWWEEMTEAPLTGGGGPGQPPSQCIAIICASQHDVLSSAAPHLPLLALRRLQHTLYASPSRLRNAVLHMDSWGMLGGGRDGRPVNYTHELAMRHMLSQFEQQPWPGWRSRVRCSLTKTLCRWCYR